MNEKEAIKQAIVILKTEYDSEGFYIPLFKTKQKALALLEQAEPPPTGEFTKRFRAYLSGIYHDLIITKTNTQAPHVQFELKQQLFAEAREACDRLDAQQQEIEKLKRCESCDKPLSRYCPRCKENWES